MTVVHPQASPVPQSLPAPGSVQRALLFTDVVDSTALTERLGDAAAAALWAAHDRAARDLLQQWRGQEIDRSDGFLMLFERADDALGFALAYHRALAGLAVALRARAGLHVGAVILRRNAADDVARGAKPVEVDGVAKPFASRVMSLALGGQTLLSAAARESLGTTGARIVSHGHWRVKGVAEPLELFEAGGGDAPFVPPPDGAKGWRVVQRDGVWVPLREVRHSLPAERDDFVGRHATLLDLARRFDADARLVSLLGLGGTGKTRLAVRFGWTWLGEFPGGVWFCDLSQARDLDGIAIAVARGLDVALGKDEPIDRLGHAIAGRGPCLVILDNFEQVARYAEATLGRWLDLAGQARFLVTSREVLGLAGEQALALPPLEAADAEDLFVRRAAAARGDQVLAGDDRAAVGPLVHLLDGLPLAIELAAARARLMSPRTLLARMSERFRLLASGGRRHGRPATLRATLDWSWELLAPAERSALAQLSVFEGGFALEAAEAVLDLAGYEPAPWIVDVLQSLVDKSLVRSHGGQRFDLLLSVREYAAERLDGGNEGEGPDLARRVQRRHCEWFASLGEARVLAGDCADADNLVAACRRAVAMGEAALAAGALEGAWAALDQRGPFSAGAELARTVCSLASLDGAAAARTRLVHGWALHALGRRDQARRELDRALEMARVAADPRLEAKAMLRLGLLDSESGEPERARRQLATALEQAIVLDEPALECAVRIGIGSDAFARGHFDEARAQFEDALSLAQRIGDTHRECPLVGNLGAVSAAVGRMDDAQGFIEQGLELARRLGDRQREANMLVNLGMLHFVQRRLDEAAGRSEEALRLVRDIGHVRGQAVVQCNLGMIHDALGQEREAIMHFDAALALARSLGDRRREGQFLGYLGRVHARLGAFGVARECFATGEALLREAVDLPSLGILLCDRAECEFSDGDNQAALQAAQEAGKIATDCCAGPQSELGLALARVQTRLTAAR